MGLLDSFKSAANSFLNTNPVGQAIKTTLNFTTAATAHPIQAVQAVASGTVSTFENKFYSQPLSKQITQIVTTTGTAAAALVGGSALASSAKAGTLVPAVVSAAKAKPLVTAAAAIIAPGVIASAITNPKTQSAIINAPSAATNFGTNLVNLATNPSIQNVKTTFQENPILTGITGAAAAIATGAATAPVISTILNTSAVKANTKATESSSSNPIISIPKGESISSSPTPVTIVNQIPATPTTTSSSTLSPTATPKKKASKPKKKAKKKVKKKAKKKKKTIKRRKTKKK